MLKLIAFLFTGCWHRWETISTHVLTYENARGSRFVLRCTRCGRHKKQDLI